MRVDVDESAEAVIVVHRAVDRVAGMHCGRMPGFHRLSNHSVDIPIAHWFAQHPVAFVWRLRGERPMRKRTDFLIACDVDSQLRLNVIRVLAGGIEITGDPRSETI